MSMHRVLGTGPSGQRVTKTRNGLINLSGVIPLAIALAVLDGGVAQADEISSVRAAVIATNIPGASAIAQVGTFLDDPTACAHPIPTNFHSYIQPGAILDPKRLLVGSRSNFGAPPASLGQDGSFLSIDPSGAGIFLVRRDFAQNGMQASTLGGAVQMFGANSPNWLNSVNNPGPPAPNTASYTGVSNPLGLSNNNAFGRIWPANAPFGVAGVGSSSILDPTGRPLKGPPNPLIGGVYVGSLTDRDAVTPVPPTVPTKLPQVIPGSLSTGAAGTALLGPSPDGTCKAVFAVVTADGAIVQEHTVKGLDGVAPAGTVRSLLEDLQDEGVDPRFGVLMNPYSLPSGVVRQLFVSEPFNNTIAVINLVLFPSPLNPQVFGLGSVSRISSPWLRMPVDLAAVKRDQDDVRWASNTTLDAGSDFYVANRADNTIVRMRQNGSVVAVRGVTIENPYLDGALLNGITTSTDGKTIYLTFTGPDQNQGGVLSLPAF
jgi:hypothetical protein